MPRSLPGLPPPRPIPIKDRASLLFLEKGRLDVLDGAFVLVDEVGVRVHIPIGGVVCLMLEPGTRVSHAAVALAARAGTLLIWVGEAGVRLYAAGQPGGARSDRLLYQARLALEDDARLNVVRKMYAIRFREEAPTRRSIDQLRGIEGARVREMYKAAGGAIFGEMERARVRPVRLGLRRHSSTVACRLQRRPCTASPRPRCSPRDMRRRSAFCIPGSRRASFTTSPISSSSRPWCRSRSGWPARRKRTARLRAAPCPTRSPKCAGVAVIRSGARKYLNG